MRLAFLIVLATLLWPGNSAGAPAASLSPEDRQLASKHYEDGKAAFKAGRLQTALLEFQLSFDLSREPLLLADMSLVAENLGRTEDAVRFGKQFLEAVKTAGADEIPSDAVSEVAERVRRLSPDPEKPRPEVKKPVEQFPPVKRKVTAPRNVILAASMLALGGLSLIASLATGIAGGNISAEVQSRPLPLAVYRDLDSRGRSLNAAAFATLAIGIAAGGGGALWLGLELRH